MEQTKNLSRFTEAQRAYYGTALAEIRNGKKESHWMWYIFPQIKGLGNTQMSQYYAIQDINEAIAFLKDSYLGQNLNKICEELLKLDTNNPTQVFGKPDDMKLRSSMTLFALATDSKNSIFDDVLRKYFDGNYDVETEKILNEEGTMPDNTYAQIKYDVDDLYNATVEEVSEIKKEEDNFEEVMSEPVKELADTVKTIMEENEQVKEESILNHMEEDEVVQKESEVEISDNKENSSTEEIQSVNEEADEEIPREEVKEPIDIEFVDIEKNQTPNIDEQLSKLDEHIESIYATMRRLERKFETEILNSETRDNTVKTIYKELNEYKAGIIEKALKNIVYDIIDMRETMISQIRALRAKNEDTMISLDELEAYADDIGDILEKHDVIVYKGEAGIENVPVRQKIIRKVETDDETMVKKVAESLGYGYEYNGKIIYPEKISIYVKKK